MEYLELSVGAPDPDQFLQFFCLYVLHHAKEEAATELEAEEGFGNVVWLEEDGAGT